MGMTSQPALTILCVYAHISVGVFWVNIVLVLALVEAAEVAVDVHSTRSSINSSSSKSSSIEIS